MVSIFQATNGTAMDHVRALMQDFLAWQRERHADDWRLVDLHRHDPGFEQELAELPDIYALAPGKVQPAARLSSPLQKRGSLLIAYHAGHPAGCVALRDLGTGICELKRMFVPADFRGLGVGRALIMRAMAEARQAGYARMRLAASKRHTEAICLYEKSGFTRLLPPDALSTDAQTADAQTTGAPATDAPEAEPLAGVIFYERGL
jgi:GNAT superfamily N-acetyltransferase